MRERENYKGKYLGGKRLGVHWFVINVERASGTLLIASNGLGSLSTCLRVSSQFQVTK